MSGSCCLLRVIVAVASIGLFAPFGLAQGKAGSKKPKITIGRDTTYVTGPVTKDGYIDYVAALNERLREGVTPENNANVLLWKALGPNLEGTRMPDAFFALMKVSPPPDKGEYFVFLSEHLNGNDPAAVPRIEEQLDVSTARAWTAKRYPELAAWLQRNEKPLAVVIEATRRSHYYYPLVPIKSKGEKATPFGGLMASNLAGVQHCRQLAAALTARAMLRTSQGQFDGAWNDLLACHRLGRLVGRGATLIEALVGIAIDGIAGKADLAYLEHANLNTKQIKARLRDLQALPPLPLIADHVNLGERFLFLDSVMLIDRTGGQLGLEPALAAAKARAGVIAWDTALRNANQWYSRMSLTMRLTDRKLRDRYLHEIQSDIKALSQEMTTVKGMAQAFLAGQGADEVVGKLIGDRLICLLTPALLKVQQAGDRSAQTENNLHLAFALAAFQRDTGRYPATLAALVPNYLSAIPGDLFTGKALIYRPSDAGYLLYSVGVNGTDDGGRGYDDDPRGDDLVVRMPGARNKD